MLILLNNYTWLASQSLIPQLSQSIYYSLRISTSQGCIGTDSLLVIPKKLQMNLGSDKNLICGSTINLDSIQSNYTAASPLQLRWSNPNILKYILSFNPTVSPIETENLIASLQTQNGCVAIDSIRILVNPITVVVNDTQRYCHDTLTLKATSNYEGAKTLLYQWNRYQVQIQS
ncbi:MAG: hypothetical protein SGJ00_09600 [bacterium]|nr:hypothetical protein [bacterium]